VTRVKGYIDAGTCNTVTFSDYSESECGDNAESYFKEFTYNGNRVLISNNIPDHAAEYDQITTNPNVRCPGWQYISMPINPGKADSFTDTDMGTTGLAITGGVFYNALSDPDGSVALANEGPSLDPCFGHSSPASSSTRIDSISGQYHYHANINCTDAGSATGANDPDECLLIGYMADGVPVYGLCKDSDGDVFTSCYQLNDDATTTDVETAGGTYTVASYNTDYTFTSDSSCNLDEANGATHPTTGEYSYFMTTGYPWVPTYYGGDQGTSNLCSAL